MKAAYRRIALLTGVSTTALRSPEPKARPLKALVDGVNGELVNGEWLFTDPFAAAELYR